MRAGITQAYIEWVDTCTRALVGHLYQFTSLAGQNDYFTDLDWDIVYNGIIWKSAGIRIDGLRRKTSVGLEVDEQDVKIHYLPADMLFGSTMLTAAEAGLLDGCLVTRFRAVWAISTGNLLSDVAAAPLQVWTMFTGYMSEITAGGQTRLDCKIKSPLVKLEINMPRNYYQPGCLWTLFDSGCTLNKASFAQSGQIGTVWNPTQISPVGGVTNPSGADGIPTYAQGRLIFTSGANSGLLTLINSNDANNIFFAYPISGMAIGDQFTYYPGCSKSFNTCQLKFANQANFRGFDKVPPVAISI